VLCGHVGDVFSIYKTGRTIQGEHDALSLLQVCRRIHAETALMPYTLNEFDLGNRPACFLGRTVHFLKKITVSQLGAIEFLSIEYPGWIFGELSKFLEAVDALPQLHTLKLYNFYCSSLVTTRNGRIDVHSYVWIKDSNNVTPGYSKALGSFDTGTVDLEARSSCCGS
jgi:hypothetical protein